MKIGQGKTINVSDRMGSMSAAGECNLPIPEGIRKKKGVFELKGILEYIYSLRCQVRLKAHNTLELRLPISQSPLAFPQYYSIDNLIW